MALCSVNIEALYNLCGIVDTMPLSIDFDLYVDGQKAEDKTI